MSNRVSSLWVQKSDLSKSEWHHDDIPALRDGELLLQIEKYALTAIISPTQPSEMVLDTGIFSRPAMMPPVSYRSGGLRA